MLYILMVRRVVKLNTGATAQYAPRTQNAITRHVCGPFSRKGAQQAMLAALGSHTCLDAQVWTEDRVREEEAKGSSRHFMEEWRAIEQAVALLDQFQRPEAAVSQ